MKKEIEKIAKDSACEQKEVRNKLELWQYLYVVESIYSAIDNNQDRRNELIMDILEDIARDAWKLGERYSLVSGVKPDEDQKDQI